MTALSWNAGRLAAPLLQLAARVLHEVPTEGAADARAALRAFTDTPSPARYVAAARALHAAERGNKLRLLGGVVGDRRAEQGLGVLARAAPLAPELLEALRALPPDARNGRRLTIIAELLSAHLLIAARASGALRELQQSLGPLPRPRPRPSQRRPRPGTRRTGKR